MTTKQPEALRLANVCSNLTRYSMDAHLIAAELRRQHNRIAELEAQLEAVGAGGVSEPLVGKPQAMPAPSPAGEASVGSELVYQARYQKGFWQDSSRERYEYLQNPENTCAEDWETRILYTHPPTAQAGGWTRLPGALPEPGTPVLLDIGKKYPIRAMWAAKHTVQAADDDTDWGEYVEADDMYYAPEGWYEWNQCEDNHWRVPETPRAWLPLPPTSAEGVEHG